MKTYEVRETLVYHVEAYSEEHARAMHDAEGDQWNIDYQEIEVTEVTE